jgi:signal transduction histidine kinase
MEQVWFQMDREALNYMISSLLAQCMQYSMGLCTAIVLVLKLKTKLISKVYLQKQKLEELNAKLMETNKELVESLKSKNDFILSFSHELRNPLTSLLGNVELVSMVTSDNNIHKYLQAAKHSGDFLMFLINNILDSAKVENNQLEKSDICIETSQFFAKCWSIFGPLIKSRGLIGELHLAKSLPETVKIDSYRIMQIMFNLIGNATKFTQAGSVKVAVSWIEGNKLEAGGLLPSESDESVNEAGAYCTTVSAGASPSKLASHSKPAVQRKISLGFQSKNSEDDNTTSFNDSIEKKEEAIMQDGYLKLEVIDTGIGISEEGLDKLFKKYSQISSEHNRLGSGLGLWITQHLCKLMKGDIRAYSKSRHGSTFVAVLKAKARNILKSDSLHASMVPNFQLPEKSLAFKKKPLSPGLSTAPNSLLATDDKKLKVIVVDDSEFILVLMRNFLENLGVSVVGTAANGLDAVKKLTVLDRQVDAVILDIEMPLMDGIQAAQLIRQYEVNNNLKPIYMAMVTGNCNEQQFKTCRQKDGLVRADAVFRKPFGFSDCQTLVTGISNQKLAMKLS